MNIEKEIRNILNDALILDGRGAQFIRTTPLLGALPELDSMAVVAVLTLIEERFGVTIGDDEIEGSSFATFGSLVDFVARKITS